MDLQVRGWPQMVDAPSPRQRHGVEGHGTRGLSGAVIGAEASGGSPEICIACACHMFSRGDNEV